MDPLLSPVFAPDEALRALPPTYILCGGLDPLIDDAVDFNTRIRRMGVVGSLRIARSMPHTFPSLPHLHVLPEAEAALAQTCNARPQPKLKTCVLGLYCHLFG